MFPKYLSVFLDVLSAERIIKQNKNTSKFPQINSCCFQQAHLSSSVSSSVSKVVLNAVAKSSCFNLRVIKTKTKKKNFKQCNGQQSSAKCCG